MSCLWQTRRICKKLNHFATGCKLNKDTKIGEIEKDNLFFEAVNINSIVST